MQVVWFRSQLKNKNTREKKRQMDPCEWRLIFLLFVGLLIMRVAEAGPITGEIGSPFGEDAAGYKGLNQGGFIDCPPLDSVISLQLVINRWHLEPLADRTVGIALRAPSLAVLRSPIFPRCSGAGINSPHTLPSSFLWGSLRFFPSNKGSGRTRGGGGGFQRPRSSAPAAGRAPPPSRGILSLTTSPFPALSGRFLRGLLSSS